MVAWYISLACSRNQHLNSLDWLHLWLKMQLAYAEEWEHRKKRVFFLHSLLYHSEDDIISVSLNDTLLRFWACLSRLLTFKAVPIMLSWNSTIHNLPMVITIIAKEMHNRPLNISLYVKRAADQPPCILKLALRDNFEQPKWHHVLVRQSFMGLIHWSASSISTRGLSRMVSQPLNSSSILEST